MGVLCILGWWFGVSAIVTPLILGCLAVATAGDDEPASFPRRLRSMKGVGRAEAHGPTRPRGSA